MLSAFSQTRTHLYLFLVLVSFYGTNIFSDSSTYNSYNNHGGIGLINMPTARFYDEASHGITLFNGTPDQKITFTSSPYDWLEASFFYTNIEGLPYCALEGDPVCSQDYKDKGFNFKIRLKQEGVLPAIAIGINDMAGTGLYSSEYIVGSYGINKLDLHFGLGWGALNGSNKSFKNPLIYIGDNFEDRPDYRVGYVYEDKGGSFHPSRYFSGPEVSPFFGLSYVLNRNFLLKIEYDPTLTPGEIGYEIPESRISYGLDYKVNENFSLGISNERDSYIALRFSYQNNPKKTSRKYKFKEISSNESIDRYTKLRRNLEENGIGVNKIQINEDVIGLELTQFTHSNLDVIEEIISIAKINSNIKEDIKKDLRIADLQAISEYDQAFIDSSKLIYERNKKSRFVQKTNISVKPFLASREEFFMGSILLENNGEYVIRDNLFFSYNLKYSIADNFDELYIPPRDIYPAQVRSDVKEYLKEFNDGIKIGRAQFDYHLTPKKNNHLMITAGILEDMFSGIGMEYLYFNPENNYAVGFELFDIKKRDYEMQFGNLDYQNVVGSVNFYYRNYNLIPFDSKISVGEYLAGDQGATFEISRTFENGINFGVFATFTDVSTEQYGEGSFDKGIFFNIPIFGNFVNYSWRPLTKDPGAKLVRKHTLHDLLVRFRPIN